jgi:hypothetical protein
MDTPFRACGFLRLTGRRPVNLKNPHTEGVSKGDTTTLSPKGLSNLRTFGAKAPSNLRTFPPEPSGHRPVKLQNPLQKGRGKPCPFCSLKAVMVE